MKIGDFVRVPAEAKGKYRQLGLVKDITSRAVIIGRPVQDMIHVELWDGTMSGWERGCVEPFDEHEKIFGRCPVCWSVMTIRDHVDYEGSHICKQCGHIPSSIIDLALGKRKASINYDEDRISGGTKRGYPILYKGNWGCENWMKYPPIAGRREEAATFVYNPACSDDESAIIKDAVGFLYKNKKIKKVEALDLEETRDKTMNKQEWVRLDLSKDGQEHIDGWNKHNGEICMIKKRNRMVGAVDLETWNGNILFLVNTRLLEPLDKEPRCQICWSKENVAKRSSGEVTCYECSGTLNGRIYRLAVGRDDKKVFLEKDRKADGSIGSTGAFSGEWTTKNWFEYPPIAERRKKAAHEYFSGQKDIESRVKKSLGENWAVSSCTLDSIYHDMETAASRMIASGVDKEIMGDYIDWRNPLNKCIEKEVENFLNYSSTVLGVPVRYPGGDFDTGYEFTNTYGFIFKNGDLVTIPDPRAEGGWEKWGEKERYTGWKKEKYHSFDDFPFACINHEGGKIVAAEYRERLKHENVKMNWQQSWRRKKTREEPEKEHYRRTIQGALEPEPPPTIPADEWPTRHLSWVHSEKKPSVMPSLTPEPPPVTPIDEWPTGRVQSSVSARDLVSLIEGYHGPIRGGDRD